MSQEAIIFLLLFGVPLGLVALFWLMTKLRWIRDDLPPGEKDAVQRYGLLVLLGAAVLGLMIWKGVIGGLLMALIIAVVVAVVSVVLGVIFGLVLTISESWKHSADAYRARLAARSAAGAPPPPERLAPFHRRFVRNSWTAIKQMPENFPLTLGGS
jgi:ABC-type dipeptide/oligopeptide/nickel transport system permease subunit